MPIQLIIIITAKEVEFKMESMITLLNDYLAYIVLGLSALVFILFILLILTYRKIKKMQNRYEKFMSKDNVDLEELLIQYTKKINTLFQNEKQILSSIKAVEKALTLCVQKVAIVRYKAIAHMGADLSFAIALLDSQNDGIVLNGIYSRDGSYTYAKPIKGGKSMYTLSDEELEALNKAMLKKSM